MVMVIPSFFPGAAAAWLLYSTVLASATLRWRFHRPGQPSIRDVYTALARAVRLIR